MKIAQLCAVEIHALPFLLAADALRCARPARGRRHRRRRPFMDKVAPRASASSRSPSTARQNRPPPRERAALKALFPPRRSTSPCAHAGGALFGRWRRVACRRAEDRLHCARLLFPRAHAWPKRAAFVRSNGWRTPHSCSLHPGRGRRRDRAALGLIRGHIIQAIGNGRRSEALSIRRQTAAARARLRQSLGASADRVVILTIGRSSPERAHVELIEAMKSVDANLWVVGDRCRRPCDPIDAALDAAERDPVLRRARAFSSLSRRRARSPGARRPLPLPSHREGIRAR